MTFEGQRQLLRLVVERVTVQEGHVKIDTVVPIGDMVKLRNGYPERSEESKTQ